MENLPEYIEGIPTNTKASRERREIIKREYIQLIEHLQNRRGKKAVFNECLQAEVFIIMRESEKKASNSAAFNWQSTWAVKHLETIIREATPQKGEPIYTLPKATGKQFFDFATFSSKNTEIASEKQKNLQSKTVIDFVGRYYWSNCAVWFFVSTLPMASTMMPFSSMTYVVRSVPSVTFPYIFFSPQASYTFKITRSVSAIRWKGSSYLAMNF